MFEDRGRFLLTEERIVDADVGLTGSLTAENLRLGRRSSIVGQEIPPCSGPGVQSRNVSVRAQPVVRLAPASTARRYRDADVDATSYLRHALPLLNDELRQSQ